MKAIALDYSMNCPCGFDGQRWILFYRNSISKKVKEEIRACPLYVEVHEVFTTSFMPKVVSKLLAEKQFERVFLEDYSYGGYKQTAVAENTGVLKYLLSQSHIEVETISISSWKKEAVGNGHAKKEQIMSLFNAIHKTNFRAASPFQDLADSYFIWEAIA